MDKFIPTICGLLQIDKPQIVCSDEHFDTPTQLAAVDILNRIIYVRPDIPNENVLIFSIAHELRHLWQGVPHGHQSSSSISVAEYNKQPEELDAHAFATFIMYYYFGVMPLFENLSSDLRAEIYSRANVLADEFLSE